MNRFSALAAAALLLGTLAACAPKDGTPVPSSDPTGGTLTPSAYTDKDFDASGDIVLATEYGVYGPDAPEVSYTITNNTPEELVYGVQYAVEVLLNGQWYQIPFPENTAWIEIGIILKPNGTNADSFSFAELDYTFKEGQYRLIKELGGKRYMALFSVGASPITAQTPFGYKSLDTLPADYSPEAAAENGDIVILHGEVKNAASLTVFLQKVALGVPAMLRITQYTDEGDAIITDCVYNEQHRGYFEFRNDNTRDKFGADTGVLESVYSYIVTDGSDIYLSSCADWTLTPVYRSADTVLLAWARSFGDVSEAVGLVQNMTADRLEWNVTRCKVFSLDGTRSVSLYDDPLSYGYEGPGMIQTQTVADPDGIVVRIADVFWLSSETYVLVCDTTGTLTYYEAVGTLSQSGYGTDYSIKNGKLEIIK